MTNKPIADTLLIIHLAKLDDKIAKSAWFKALEKIGMVISIWPIPREQLPQWVMQRAKQYKIQMNLDAAQVLSDYVEGNLSAATQALEKIRLLQPETPVDGELIHQVLNDESRFTVFDFTEHLLLGDQARTHHILDTLKADGTEPTLILWSITRELRLLAELAHHIQQGQRYEALFQQYRIFFRRQAAFRRFLTNASTHDCWHLLKEAAQLDQIIKGAVAGNVWDSLRLFCLRLV